MASTNSNTGKRKFKHLSRIFKDEKGINYIDYVTNCRISKAKDLLVTTDDSIKKISAKVGYSNSAYFSRKFKEATGITPSEYRLEQSKKQFT